MIDTSVIVAAIGAIATIVAAIIASHKNKKPSNESAPPDHLPSREAMQDESLRLDPISDPTDLIQRQLSSLPPQEAPESALFPIIENLFRRPAFYMHKERDFIFALYAVAKTRLIWEQDVIPRLRMTHRAVAATITEQLLVLEDDYAGVLGLSPEELTHLISHHVGNKAAFNHHAPRKFVFDRTRIDAETRREAYLRELSRRLSLLGVAAPALGKYGVTGSPGSE